MSVRLYPAESVCPVCLGKTLTTITVGDDDFIHMEKTCPDHGFFDTLLWEGDVVSYLSWANDDVEGNTPKTALPAEKGCPLDCGLCTEHRSEACCVLLELTKRCNLRCPVCFASAGAGTETDLPLDEIVRQYDWLMAHGGPYNIQLSGGEPTVRDDLDEIIRLGRERGFTYFQLNTNGVRIAEEDDYARRLKEMGVSCVFLQFDGCRDEINAALRGKALFETKCRAIEACAEAGLPVVLVPVIAPGINEEDIGEIIRFALDRHPHVRGVHFQPLSYFGRCEVQPRELENKCCETAKTQWRITIPRMLKKIEEQTDGLIQAADFHGGGAESPYCSFHASYRIKDGVLKALKKRTRSCCCAQPSSEAMNFVSQQWGNADPSFPDTEGDVSSLDEFLRQAITDTFTVSGMLFQDAWNIDLKRLRRCYIMEADSERGMVPFCAYNLTDINGKALYRK
ncbi:MAG: radical SAM protein [Erysipelotrichaceae bacterium]|nr:radical SAM protein [Erysipelotrichaceae bacterium]